LLFNASLLAFIIANRLMLSTDKKSFGEFLAIVGQ